MALSLLMAPAVATAQTAAPGNCRIETLETSFRQYSALDPFPNVARGRIVVDCRGTGISPTRVTLSAGRSGNPLDRRMTRGDRELRYNLFVDPSRRRVAGDGSGGSSALVPRTRAFGRNIFVIYGVIPPQQAVDAGEYSDSIRVELEF